MRNQHTRDILYLDCQLFSEPDGAPVKSIDWWAEKFSASFQAGERFTYWSRDRKRKVFIRDLALDTDNSILWLLLYTTDAEASDASFAHMETDVQRDEAKAEGEGRPQSAHVAISLAELPSHINRHLVLLEESSVLPRARVERYLNSLIRFVRKKNANLFKTQDKSGAQDGKGNPILVSYYNKVELLGHLSEDFQDDLNAGGLIGIALETGAKEHIGFGEGKRLVPIKKQITLSPRGSWKDDPSGTLKEALRLGRKNDLESARITFRSSDKMSHTAVLDTETGNVLNDGFIKKVRLNAKETFLPEASTAFHETLQGRMTSLLKIHLAGLGG